MVDNYDLTLLKKFDEENLIEQQTQKFFNLLVLLYAEDTIILTESNEDMQKTLQTVSDCCETSNLKINCDETKYMIFPVVKSAMPNQCMLLGYVSWRCFQVEQHLPISSKE